MKKITSTIAGAIMIAFAVAGCTPTGATSVPPVSPSETMSTPTPTEVTPTPSPTVSQTPEPSSTPTTDPTTEPSQTASPTVKPTISATEEPEPTEKPKPVRKWEKPVDCKKIDKPLYANVAQCKVKGKTQEEIFQACIKSADVSLYHNTDGKMGVKPKGYTPDEVMADFDLCGAGSGFSDGTSIVYGIPDRDDKKAKKSRWFVISGKWKKDHIDLPFNVKDGLLADRDNVVDDILTYYGEGD